jgi:hypothetical protein
MLLVIQASAAGSQNTAMPNESQLMGKPNISDSITDVGSAGSTNEVMSTGISEMKSAIPSDNNDIILDITYPLEDDVIYYDVAPAYLIVEGTL